jgi:hypothetical protein
LITRTTAVRGCEYGGVPTQTWEYDGKKYELLIHYAVPDEAWSLELTDASGGNRLLCQMLIPDEDVGRRACAVVHLSPNDLPGNVLRRLLVEVAEEARRAGVSAERARR